MQLVGLLKVDSSPFVVATINPSSLHCCRHSLTVEAQSNGKLSDRLAGSVAGHDLGTFGLGGAPTNVNRLANAFRTGALGEIQEALDAFHLVSVVRIRR